MKKRVTPLLAILALLAPALAFAHPGALADHAHTSFMAGLLHPLTGADHLAAMLAVGVWSALAIRPVWLAPLAFVAMLPGFEGSSPGYLRRQFIARPGRLVVAADRMTLLLAPLPLGVLLRHAGLHGWTGRLTQARDVLLRIEVEDT